ncbi:hypothetical protein JST56_07515 [Candidatus Dependentiae bacterium]|nr:hypothetical protein [Candidatus Dependentiae bacterium]
MFHNTKIGLLLVCTALLVVAQSKSGINPLALNGLFACFHPGQEMYAPNLGLAALKIGTVEAIRLYGVEPGFESNGERKWIEDKAPVYDPVVALARVLFPSATGQLTPETSSPNNIGRYLQVSDLAQLLNFCKKARAVIGGFDLLRGKDNQEVKSYWMSGNRFGKNAVNCLKRLVAGAQSDEDKKYFSTFLKSFKENFTPLTEFQTRAQRDQVIAALCKIIEREERTDWYSKNLYPKYQAEQLLNAFFCLKFGADDIPELLNALDDTIVDREILLEAGLITHQSVDAALGKVKNFPAKLCLDDVWTLLLKDSLSKTIPYSSKELPINNGLASMYSRKQDKFLIQDFPDCAETTVRHLCNLVLYSKEHESFDLRPLCNHLKNSLDFRNIENFYALQTADKANSGERALRNALNRIVADIGSGVRYRKKGTSLSVKNDNELDSGIINILRLLNTVFLLELDPEPQYESDNQFVRATKIWAQVGLKKLFTILSPEKQVDIQVEELKIFQGFQSNERDCEASITVTVNNDFRFVIDIWSGHAEFRSITELQNEPESLEYVSQSIKSVLNNLKGTVGESFYLLDEPLKKEVSVPFYKFFKNRVSDSVAIVHLLEGLSELLENKEIIPDDASLYLKNLLKDFLWLDRAMAENIQPVIKRLKDALIDVAGPCRDVLRTNVKVLKTQFFDEASDSLLEFFSRLEIIRYPYFQLSDEVKPFDIVISHPHASIKTIDLGDSQVGNVAITANLPSLENINLNETRYLNTVQINGKIDRLKEIKIQDSQLKQFNGIENCPNIGSFIVKNNNNLKKIKISQPMKKLKYIALENCSALEHFQGIEHCPNLKRFAVFGARKLKRLNIARPMVQLEYIILEHTGVERITLSSCPELEIIKLSRPDNAGEPNHVKSIEFTGNVKKLKEIENLEQCNRPGRSIFLQEDVQPMEITDDLSESYKPELRGIEFCSEELLKKIRPFVKIVPSRKRSRQDAELENDEDSAVGFIARSYNYLKSLLYNVTDE